MKCGVCGYEGNERTEQRNRPETTISNVLISCPRCGRVIKKDYRRGY